MMMKIWGKQMLMYLRLKKEKVKDYLMPISERLRSKKLKKKKNFKDFPVYTYQEDRQL